jgi:hypothetical protein
MVRISALVLFFGLSTSLTLSAQNNCTASIPTGTCLAPSPVQVWCQGNNTQSTCPGGTSKFAFYTTTPAAGSWTNQFEGVDAASILDSDSVPRGQVDAYGGIGPITSSGVGQYLEVAGGYIQAFDRATGNGVFSHRTGTAAIPQALSGLFYPGGTSYCGIPSADAIASYDRIDGVFVAGNIFHPSNTGNYLCIGVSASVGGVPANNLEGYEGESYWNVYAYNLTPAIPSNPEGQTYFPDYERFGTWRDGFYVAFDLEDPATNDVNIVGFEVCKLDKTDMIAGLSTNAPVCYTYIPSYVTGTNGTNASLIHTLLPADFEGENSIPSTTKGEYFLALVNPSNSGTNVQCSASPCTSDQLALWTWSGFENGAGPSYITFGAHPFTPGCYSPTHPWLTVCIPEPYGGVTDSVGDRLMSRLAYRNLTGSKTGEFLAVAHTVQENATTLRTGIQYYQIQITTKATISLIGDIQDTTHDLFLSVPSVAMDKNGDLGIAFTVIGNSSVSQYNYDPSPYFITVSSNGAIGTPFAILSDSGSSGQDETDSFWGEYISVSSDPDDDLTFWSANEYMNGNQTNNCFGAVTTGCTWATRVFACKEGSGC